MPKYYAYVPTDHNLCVELTKDVNIEGQPFYQLLDTFESDFRTYSQYWWPFPVSNLKNPKTTTFPAGMIVGIPQEVVSGWKLNQDLQVLVI